MQFNHYPFTLMELPYEQNALEPYIGAETVFYHHEKHLKKYVDNLNTTLRPFGQLYNWPLERLLIECEKLPPEIRTSVRNNGGGVYNHNLYFSQLTPVRSQPSGEIKKAINSRFGSYERMKSQLKEASISQFGSGYGFLVSDRCGVLSICQTANQDTVLPKGLMPIIAIDVWEHAYYLQYQNRREEYVENIFNILNWMKIGKIYDYVINSCR